MKNVYKKYLKSNTRPESTIKSLSERFQRSGSEKEQEVERYNLNSHLQ